MLETIQRLFLVAFCACSIASCSLFSSTPEAPKNYQPEGYSIETIQTPEKIRFHATGLDTSPNGEVYVATRLGDVWVYRGGQWHKFAEGLHEPTGLLVEGDGSILVAQKPELTRLIDEDGDAVADQYVRVASGWDFHDNYHEYHYGPVKDQHGNLYGSLNLGHEVEGAINLGLMQNVGGLRGWAYKVDKNGAFTKYASGLRSPAGIGISPLDEIFFTDNQGDWIPTSKLDIMQERHFYGHPASLIDHPDYNAEMLSAMSAKDFGDLTKPPAVWIPHVEVANSPGNPEWDTTEGKFGPFTGQVFVGDQTQSNIFRVILEKVNGVYQGAVINFMDGFQSGNIRIDFDDDGQLWIGQTARGWSAKGGRPYGIQKVTWDGTTPFELLDISLTPTGFRMNFTDKIDGKLFENITFSASQWSYRYSRNYGSPKVGEKNVSVDTIALSDDGLSVELVMPLEAGKVIAIDFSGIVSTDGRSPSVSKVYYTLNSLR